MKCQVFIGRDCIIDTVMDPVVGPLTGHQIPRLAREAQEAYVGKGKAIIKRAAKGKPGKGGKKGY